MLLSKYLSGEYDQCGVVVRDRSCDVPYLLEVGCTGRVQLLACDTRLLHSSSHEVIVRKLDCRRTRQQLDDIEQLIAHFALRSPLEQQQHLSAFSRPLTSSWLLPIARLLRLTVACVTVGAGGGETTRSLHQLGQFIQTRQERERTGRRVAILTGELSSAALEADSRARLVGKQQRLAGVLQRLERRESELRRQVEKSRTPAAVRHAGSVASDGWSDVAASACPSAAVVALVLQRLAVLPGDSWPPGSDCSVPPPALSHYQPKHFLSSITLPIAADAVLERELFLKSAGKPLPYNVTYM